MNMFSMQAGILIVIYFLWRIDTKDVREMTEQLLVVDC